MAAAGVRAISLLLPVLAAVAGTPVATACPFCGPVGRSLAERRDAAARVLIAAAEPPATRDDDGLLVQSFAVLAAIRGGAPTQARLDAARVEAIVAPAGLAGCTE